ncbi:hypothetical protein [Kitasatospora sp. NPDC059327]|uniref:hypothetical protein n=1 Tax=Kitasatospora sp. NPDC059327 TaxID=3346803 RepID=UPI0036A165DA
MRTPPRTPLRSLSPVRFRGPFRTALGAALLGTVALTGATATTATATTAPATREVNQGYSIPVGAVTDLGALPVLGTLGLDFARLLGQ